MSTKATLKNVMRELEELEELDEPKMREANESRGDDHGVNLTRLRGLAKRLKTTPDHWVYPGTIIRKMFQEGDSSYVRTHGIGVNRFWCVPSNGFSPALAGVNGVNSGP